MKYYKFRYITTYNMEYTIEANSEEEAQTKSLNLMQWEYLDEEAMKSGDYNYEHHFEEEVDEKYDTHFD